MRCPVPAFLLQLLSKVSLHHIEADLARFEREVLTDPNYLVGRSGKSAYYVIRPGQLLGQPREVARFHELLTEEARRRIALDWLSLVEVMNPFKVVEPATVGPPGWGEGEDAWPLVLEDESLASKDHCGQLRHARTEANYFKPELIRVRSGLRNWLSEYVPNPRGRSKSRDNGSPAFGLLIQLHQPLDKAAGFIRGARAKFGPSCNLHMRDERTALLTWRGIPPKQVFALPRFRDVVENGLVHSLFCFTLGQEKHSIGSLLSVLPPAKGRSDEPHKPSPPRPTLVVAEKESAEAARRREAFAKLKESVAKRHG